MALLQRSSARCRPEPPRGVVDASSTRPGRVVAHVRHRSESRGLQHIRGLVTMRTSIEDRTTTTLVASQNGAGHALATAADPKQVSWTFVVPEYVTRFGESLKVVGSVPELGSWNLGLAPDMIWQPGHRWQLATQLPVGIDFEFKVVAVLHGEVRWEQGINRVVQTDKEVTTAPVELVITLTCHFNLTTATGMQLILDRQSVQESYELAAATLELLEKRRGRLLRALEKGKAQGRAADEVRAEAARLDEAVTSQSNSLAELTALVSNAIPSEDGRSLLLDIVGGKLQLPKEVRSLGWSQNSSVSMALAGGGSFAAAAAPALPSPPEYAPYAPPTSGAADATTHAYPSPSPAPAALDPAVVASNGHAAAPPPSVLDRETAVKPRRLAAEEPVEDGAVLPVLVFTSDDLKAQAPSLPVVDTGSVAAPPEEPAHFTISSSTGFTVVVPPSVADDNGRDGSPAVRRVYMFGNVDLSTLPPPTTTSKGALFFSEELLNAVSLPGAQRDVFERSAAPSPSPMSVVEDVQAAVTASRRSPSPPPPPLTPSSSSNGNGGAVAWRGDAVAAVHAFAENGGGAANATSGRHAAAAEIAGQLAELSASISKELQTVAATMDAAQQKSTWQRLEGMVNRAQGLQQRLMGDAGLNTTQTEELRQLQELIRFAKRKLRKRSHAAGPVSAYGSPRRGAAKAESAALV